VARGSLEVLKAASRAAVMMRGGEEGGPGVAPPQASNNDSEMEEREEFTAMARGELASIRARTAAAAAGGLHWDHTLVAK